MRHIKEVLRKLRENEDGLSLLEVIISIGILALASGFILQMFIVSANLNRRAKDADTAVLAAKAAIEEFKGLGEAPEPSASYTYYDCNWNTPVSGSVGDVLSRVAFIREIIVTEDILAGGGGRLFTVRVSVSSMGGLDTEREVKEIVTFETKKYFSGNGGESR